MNDDPREPHLADADDDVPADVLAELAAGASSRALGGGVHIRRDSRGRLRFSVRVREANGKHGSRTFATRRGAELYLENRSGLRGSGVGLAPGELLPHIYANLYYWATEAPGHADSTRAGYARILKVDFAPFFARLGLPIGALAYDHGDEYVRWLLEQKATSGAGGGLATATAAVDEAVEAAGRVFKFALARRHIEINPVAHARRYHVDGRAGRRARQVLRDEVLDPFEVEAIRRELRFRDPVRTLVTGTLILFCATHGCGSARQLR